MKCLPDAEVAALRLAAARYYKVRHVFMEPSGPGVAEDLGRRLDNLDPTPDNFDWFVDQLPESPR
jgi:hypothetical protein